MAQGKILIVNKINGAVLGWLGEGADNSRPSLENIQLVELDAGAYDAEFMNNQHGLDGITVTDIANKVLAFDTSAVIPPPTYEELQQQLLKAQGVI
jgi:hypothetical protein